MKKYNKLIASSVNSERISLTIRGTLRLLIPVAMSLAPFLSVDPQELTDMFDSVNALLDSADTLVAAGLAFWGSFEVVIGAVRKLAVALKIIKIS